MCNHDKAHKIDAVPLVVWHSDTGFPVTQEALPNRL